MVKRSNVKINPITEEHPGYKCYNCVWSRKIINNRKTDYLNILCLFPNCVKKEQEEKK